MRNVFEVLPTAADLLSIISSMVLEGHSVQ